jgi:hypothetical protein
VKLAVWLVAYQFVFYSAVRMCFKYCSHYNFLVVIGNVNWTMDYGFCCQFVFQVEM